MQAVGVEGCAQRAAGIARRRGHEEVAEPRLAQDARVRAAVQGDAAAEAEVLEPVSRWKDRARSTSTSSSTSCTLLATSAKRVALRRPEIDGLPGIARRPELGDEPIGEAAPRAFVKLEIRQVEREGPVRRAPQHPAQLRLECGLSVRGETHHLVLALVHGEAQVGREGGVEHPERVREAELADELERRAAVVGDRAASERERRPLADAVGGEDRGLPGRRSEERGRRVRAVVLGEQDAVAGHAELGGDRCP